jgi:tetratricopeptide (TPR) repeat protein
MIGILPILSLAQETGKPAKETRKEKRQDFNKFWYVGLNLGAFMNQTDLSQNHYTSDVATWQFGYGGQLGWQFKPIWGLRLRSDAGKLYGKRDAVDPWLIQNTIFHANIFDYHLDLTINLSNLISGYRGDRVVDVFAVGGIGQAQWRSWTNVLNGDDTYGVLLKKDGVDPNEPATTAKPAGYQKGFNDRYLVTEGVGGLGLAFHVTPSFDLALEEDVRFLNTDNLEGVVHGTKAVKVDMYSSLMVSAIFKFGQNDPLKKMKKDFPTVTFKTEPDPLEAHGGKVAMKITGTFPAGYFNPKAAMWAEPYLMCEGMKIPLKPILLKGTDVGGEGIPISKDGGSFTYETTVDYNTSCRVDTLYLDPILFIPKGDLPANMKREDVLAYKKHVELPAKKLADGTIITPQKFAFYTVGSIVPHGYVKEVILTKDATIYFEVNKYALNWNVPMNKVEANKTKLTELINFLSLGYKVRDINIDGWASPEGEETFNQGLSENRTKTAYKYLADKITGLIKAKGSKMTIKDAEKDLKYNMIHHGPDWNGFITTVQNSDMKDKNIILNVINNAGTPAKKEQEIRNMIKIYPELETKILPPLRRAEIVINCYEPKKTDEEIISLSTSNPNNLDEKELLYAASLQKDNKIKLAIYKSAINQFPNSYKGYANAGAIEVETGDLKAAQAHLEKAVSLNPNSGEVHNNLGILYGLQGDYTKAEQEFIKAGQLGTDASYNLGVLSIHKGEYAKAISQFGNKTCDYNVALAYIASKNYPPAEKQLNCAPKDAQTYYLTAILGSRTNNTTMLFDNLGKAIQANPAYKQEAKIDREFIKYFADPKFISLVQ